MKEILHKTVNYFTGKEEEKLLSFTDVFMGQEYGKNLLINGEFSEFINYASESCFLAATPLVGVVMADFRESIKEICPERIEFLTDSITEKMMRMRPYSRKDSIIP